MRAWGKNFVRVLGGAAVSAGRACSERDREPVQLREMRPRELGYEPVALLGQFHAHYPGVVGVLLALHEAGRPRAVHEPHRAVAPQQQVSGNLADRGWQPPRMSLDRHEQLVLHMREADRRGLVLAPALETAQLDPERQEVLEILSGWLNGILLDVTFT